MRNSIVRILRSKALQAFWTRLHKLSLIGQNYWGTDFETNGELTVLRMLSERLAGGIIIDAGANIGSWSRHALSIACPDKIFAFEPSVEAYSQIKRNAPGVTAIRAALGERNCVSTLHTPSPGATVASLKSLRQVNRPFDAKFDELVDVLSLDDFCAERGITEIAFLKLDVEGTEIDVLKGAERLLNDDAIQYVQFEFGEAHIDTRCFLRDFFDRLPRFEFFRIVRDGLVPLNAYRPEYEIFTSANFLAKLTR